MILLALHLLLVHIVFGHAIFLLLLRVSACCRDNKVATLLTSLGLAPGIVSLALYFLFMIIPDQPHLLYMLVVTALFIALLAASRPTPLKLVLIYREILSTVKEHRHRSHLRGLALLFTIAAIGLVFYSGVFFPIQSTDALRHAAIGRMLAQDRSLVHFPITSPLENGFITNVLYPPGLHLLYASSYLSQASYDSDIGARVVAPIFAFLTIALVWRWGDKLGKDVGILAAFSLTSMCSYLQQVGINSVDAFRMFFFFAAFFWLRSLIRSFTVPILVLVCLLLSLAVFTHTIGLLALPAAAILYCLLSRKTGCVRRFGTGTLLILPPALIGGMEYIRRFAMLGEFRPASLYFKAETSDLLTQRGLTSFYRIIVEGALRLFTQPQIHGLLGCLFLVALVLLLSRRYRQNKEFVYSIAISILGAGLIWFAPSPTIPGWANSRYIMTIAPFLALGAGVALRWGEHLLQSKVVPLLHLQAPRRALSLLLVSGAIVLFLVAVFLSPSLVATRFSADGVLDPSTVLHIDYVRNMSVMACLFALLGGLMCIDLSRHRTPTLFLVAGTALVVAGVLLSPSFVTAHLDPGRVAEAATTLRIQILRTGLLLLGIVSLSLSMIAKPIGALERWRSRLQRFQRRWLEILPMLLLAVVVVLPSIAFFRAKGITPRNGFRFGEFCLSDETKLANYSENYGSIFWLNESTPEDSLVLVSTDASFFYYANRSGLFWKDLRMQSFFDAPSPTAAFQALLNLGVDYLQITEGMRRNALYINSHFDAILSDPDMCSLVWESTDGMSTQVFKVKNPN